MFAKNFRQGGCINHFSHCLQFLFKHKIKLVNQCRKVHLHTAKCYQISDPKRYVPRKSVVPHAKKSPQGTSVPAPTKKSSLMVVKKTDKALATLPKCVGAIRKSGIKMQMHRLFERRLNNFAANLYNGLAIVSNDRKQKRCIATQPMPTGSKLHMGPLMRNRQLDVKKYLMSVDEGMRERIAVRPPQRKREVIWAHSMKFRMPNVEEKEVEKPSRDKRIRKDPETGQLRDMRPVREVIASSPRQDKRLPAEANLARRRKSRRSSQTDEGVSSNRIQLDLMPTDVMLKHRISVGAMDNVPTLNMPNSRKAYNMLLGRHYSMSDDKELKAEEENSGKPMMLVQPYEEPEKIEMPVKKRSRGNKKNSIEWVDKDLLNKLRRGPRLPLPLKGLENKLGTDGIGVVAAATDLDVGQASAIMQQQSPMYLKSEVDSTSQNIAVNTMEDDSDKGNDLHLDLMPVTNDIKRKLNVNKPEPHYEEEAAVPLSYEEYDFYQELITKRRQIENAINLLKFSEKRAKIDLELMDASVLTTPARDNWKKAKKLLTKTKPNAKSTGSQTKRNTLSQESAMHKAMKRLGLRR